MYGFHMKERINEFAKLYESIHDVFGRKTLNIIVGFAIFFVLLILNGYIYFSGAQKPSGELVVVIDAGHGGNDPGKVSSSGVDEKDVNLAIALKLREQLENRGVKVVMTRENDSSLANPEAINKKTSDLNNRVEIINASNANCLISIHQNSYPDKAVHGAQVFYHGTSEESRELATHIQKKIIADVDSSNKRKEKEGNDYFILRKSVCPGVIIECGFLSCPNETAKLIDDKYQDKLACAIADSVCEVYNFK